VDKAFFRWYQTTILLPFIQQLCVEKFSRLGWNPGDSLVPGMEAVASFDGAGPQLNAVTSEDFLSECALQWIQMIKLNPNATAVEQPWDVSVCYKLLHAWAKLSRKGVCQPAETIKARVKEALGNPTIRDKFVLGADRQDALIDLCGKLPQMLQQALTPQHIRNGFMRSGMISTYGDTPYFRAIHKTRNGDYSQEEVHLLHTTLVSFLKISQEFGYIPEVEFDKAGYQLNQTPDGAKFLRDKEICQEGQMRARSLGHSFARAQRNFMRGAALQALTDKSLKETDDVKVGLLRSKTALDQVYTSVKIRLGVCAFLPKKGERCEVWVEGDWWMARVVKKIIDNKMGFRYTHPNGVSFGSEESLKVGAHNFQALTGAHEDDDEHGGAGGAENGAEGGGGHVDEADEIEQERTRDKEFVAQHPD